MSLRAVLFKETLVLLRSNRARWALFVYLLLLSGVVVWNWPTGNVLTLAAMASQRMVYVVGVGQLLLLLAIVPGLTAGSIVLERELGTLELLQASRLSPLAVLLGKWIGTVLFVVLLLACSFPLLMLCIALGTLNLTFIGQVSAHLLGTALWAGMVGLGVSALARSTYAAHLATYSLIVGLCVLPIAPTLLRIGGAYSAVARNCSPIGSMISLLTPDVWLRFGAVDSALGGMSIYALFSAAVALVFGLIAWWILRRPSHPRVHRGGNVIDDRREIFRRKLRFPFYLIDPQRRRRQIGNWINPILARELRSRMLGQATMFLRAFNTVFIFSLLLTLYSVVRTGSAVVDSVRVVVIASQVIVIALLCPPLTAPAVSHERELGTLDLLRLSRIGPWRLLFGKWCYALFVSTCILVAAAPMWFVIFRMQRVTPESLTHAIAVILAAVACTTVGGLMASSWCKRTGPATGASYLAAFAVLFGTLLPVLFPGSMSAGLREWCLSLNPSVAAVRAVSLGLFWRLVGSDAWLKSSVFLLTILVLFFVIAILRTRALYQASRE